MKFSIGVGKSTHARHDAQHVVVGGVDAAGDVGDGRAREAGVGVGCERLGCQRQVQRGIVNAGEVARARRLQVLRLQGEAVHVDADRRRVRVVLVRLHEVEVAAVTLRETVLAVQLDLGDRRGVAAVEIRVAERVVVLGVAVHVVGVLGDPDQLLARVVELHADLVGRGGQRLRASELQLLNEVLVRDLGEPPALLRVQVDVVHPQRAGDQALAVDAVDHGGGGVVVGLLSHLAVHQVADILEVHVDLDLVVLEGDQRQRQAGVAAEPELQRDVQSRLRQAADVGRQLHTTRAHTTVHQRLTRVRGVRHILQCRRVVKGVKVRAVDQLRGLGHSAAGIRRAGIAQAAARARQSQATDRVRDTVVVELLADGQRQLIPDVQPLTVLAVNQLAADLHLNLLHQRLADVAHPAERRDVVVADIQRLHRRQRGLQVDLVDQVTVACNRALHTLAEVRHTVERLLNGLQREVRVPAVQLLEKSHLRVRRQVYVLRAIGYELHEATVRHS